MKFLYLIKVFLSLLHILRLYSVRRLNSYTDICLIYCSPTNLFIIFSCFITENYLFASIVSTYDNLRRTLILNGLKLWVTFNKTNEIITFLYFSHHIVFVQEFNYTIRFRIGWNNQKTRFLSFLFCISQQMF